MHISRVMKQHRSKLNQQLYRQVALQVPERIEAQHTLHLIETLFERTLVSSNKDPVTYALSHMQV
jgi:hypothetical protein